MDGIYTALIGDIRGSRELEDRAGVQQELASALGEVNEDLAASLAAEMVITTGDEFQGLFHVPSAAVEALGRLDERLAELSFAFGLGRGGLETSLEPEAVGMDGPCFHRARAAIEAADPTPAGVEVRGFGTEADAHASAMLGLVQATRSDWTQVQCRYALAVRDADTQQAVAEAFQRSKSSVSESLSAAHAREVHAAETQVGTYLDRAHEEDAP